MYKHYFKTEDGTLTTTLTTDSGKAQHFRTGNTGTDEKKHNLFFLWQEHLHSVTRTMKWGQEEECFQGIISSFVQNKYAQFEQHHLGSVLSAVKHFQLSSKCWLHFRVFRVLRFDQVLLKASFPLLLGENSWPSLLSIPYLQFLLPGMTTGAAVTWGCPRGMAVKQYR